MLSDLRREYIQEPVSISSLINGKSCAGPARENTEIVSFFGGTAGHYKTRGCYDERAERFAVRRGDHMLSVLMRMAQRLYWMPCDRTKN